MPSREQQDYLRTGGRPPDSTAHEPVSPDSTAHEVSGQAIAEFELRNGPGAFGLIPCSGTMNSITHSSETHDSI